MHDIAASAGSHDAVDTLIEQRPWTVFRLSLLLICFSATLMDGAHQLTMAVAGPAVMRDVPMSSTGFGFVMAASEFGFMLGALALSPLVDRLGRKRMLLLSTLAFGLFSVATAFAHTLPILFATRLFTGIGLGCAGPAVVSLATEYTPLRHRARIATLIWAANPAGAFASGLLGGLIVPQFGWRELFVMAGALTMVFVVLIAAFVPESLRFLLVRAPQDPRVARILKRLGAADARSIVDNPKLREQTAQKGVPVGILFEGRNRGFTAALWLAFFLCFMCLLGSLTWTVAILVQAKLTLETASMVLACNSIGGTLGVALAGWAMERLGGARLLVVTFVLGILTIVGMGQVMGNLPLLSLLSALTGLFIGGNTAGLIALAVQRYPTTVRATGLGWALAAGRLGGALGPILMGMVAATGAEPAGLFVAMAVPAALATIVVLPLCRPQPAAA
jgi:AAHS family 4-hydroxybenzoate transporter-like MFS transporter